MKLIKYPSKEQWTELLKRPALNTESLFDTVRSIINKVRTEGDKARDRAGGHGLGLAILQKILALHGLTCKAENIKGGVRFIVCNKD